LVAFSNASLAAAVGLVFGLALVVLPVPVAE